MVHVANPINADMSKITEESVGEAISMVERVIAVLCTTSYHDIVLSFILFGINDCKSNYQFNTAGL